MYTNHNLFYQNYIKLINKELRNPLNKKIIEISFEPKKIIKISKSFPIYIVSSDNDHFYLVDHFYENIRKKHKIYEIINCISDCIKENKQISVHILMESFKEKYILFH